MTSPIIPEVDAKSRGANLHRAGGGPVHGLVIAGYLLLTVIMTWPMTPRFFQAIPGDSFDGWQNYWNLWWVKIALVDRVQNPFFTDILFAPTGVGLYFHTLNPFNGLATLPVQLSAGLIPAYNAVVYLSWTLGGYGVFLLTLYALRHWTNGRAGPASRDPETLRRLARLRLGSAFVAGAVFTFSPFHMAHLLGHMQVMSLQWIPFYILYLLRAMDGGAVGKPWLRNSLFAGLFLILTGLCDWYFVLYLMLFTGLLMVWRLGSGLARRAGNYTKHGHESGLEDGATHPRFWVSVLGAPLVAGLLFASVLSPILWPMVQEVRAFSFMVRPATDLYILSASLVDFLVPNRLHTLFRPESFEWIGNRIAPVSERTIGIGYLPLALFGVALWLRPRWVALWGATALFFLLLALGPRMHLGEITWEHIPMENTEAVLRGEWSPFGLINQAVPLVRMSRSVSRYALMVQLAVAVGMGVGLVLLGARLVRGVKGSKGGSRRVTALWAGALCIVLAEFWVAPYPMSPPDTPEYYARLDAELPPGAVLNLPMNWDRPGYLLYQTVHQRPLTVAYISREDPRTATDRYPFLQQLRHLGNDILADEPAVVGKTVLADLGVGAVTLDRYKMPGGPEREITEAVAAQVFGDQPPHFEDHRITVYGVEPPARLESYLALGPLYWGALEVLDEPGFVQSAVAQSEGENHDVLDRRRALRADPATLLIRHLQEPAEVAIYFDGEAGATLHIAGPHGVREVLPAQADGAVNRFAVAVAPSDVPGPVEIELWATDGPIYIYRLALEQR